MTKLIGLLFLSSIVSATSIERVIEKTEPKVVKIEITKDKGTGVCSGVFVTPTGIILTCAHCFEGKVKGAVVVTSEGRKFPVQPLLISRIRDLALIAPLAYIGKFPYIELGKDPKIGQQVVSLGSPLNMQHTATAGWVDNFIQNKVYTYVLHSAFVNPGNSGGPLVDLSGRLVGINEATIGYGFFDTAHGLYIAVSLKTIKEIWHGKL